ncbi:MAG: hypothetical protein LBH28_08215, partial [Oscillospiraceae bacterium]|nr:hypothetical protein [Oscillospiraceae bacterium]
MAYTYYPSGLRATKASGAGATRYVLDGGNVALETVNGNRAANYTRALNLVSSIIGNSTNWYLYNAHGDVVQLT